MAKKRHISPIDLPRGLSGDEVRDIERGSVSRAEVDPLGVAAGLLAGLLIYVTYVPSDSVAVEHGDALWVTFLSLVIATVTFTFYRPQKSQQSERVALAIDLLPWIIALWVMMGAFRLSPAGNLRVATNEAWLWIAGAAVFTAARRLFAPISVRRSMLLLMIACASGLAVHGLHQHYVSLPHDRARYHENPDAVLQEAGFDAPEGSSLRMVFENRLNDGGATATFGLANSLAAVLLVGVVGAFGGIRLGWAKRLDLPRWGWFVAAAVIAVSLCGVGLLTTASRSALVATILSIAILTVLARFGRSLLALMGIAVAASLVVFLIASMGNAEWFEQAPASLSFRFRYWRSTAQLVLQSPWFGAGPGNFQSAYERFREDGAHEQIADPHNLFFETLASGGLVAAIALIVLMSIVALIAAKRFRSQADQDSINASTSSMKSKWVWLGAILGLVVVWLLSIATGSMPDIEAHLFAIPAAIFVAVVGWPSIQKLSSSAVDLIASACLFGLILHLMVSGGWTVPGVAIYVWLFAAILSRGENQDAGNDIKSPADHQPRRWSHGIGMLMVALIASLYFISIIPIQQSRSAIVAARAAGNRGALADMQEHLDKAITLDPWAVDALMQKTDLLRWGLVVEEPSRSKRAAWELSVAAVKRRAGNNPTVLEEIGKQQIHLYQRHGDRQDLRSARTTFRTVTRWSRANEGLFAQLALIEMELGNRNAAVKSAQRASELSAAGGIFERSLTKQLVAEVKPIGKLAERQVKIGFASDLMGDLMGDLLDDIIPRESPNPP